MVIKTVIDVMRKHLSFLQFVSLEILSSHMQLFVKIALGHTMKLLRLGIGHLSQSKIPYSARAGFIDGY
ncbi:hypothetical protein XMA121_000745 [Marinobacterium sp. xm-a-121]|nr:hypothetical protein [Marinobacterium sp. xm-a-152]NRP38141.1 hypothetical protein [Marinobacterium sp. xm-a-121]NRP98843.1 hypothetical protein [Marinobacterium sp. xm-v-233]